MNPMVGKYYWITWFLCSEPCCSKCISICYPLLFSFLPLRLYWILVIFKWILWRSKIVLVN